MHGDGQSVVVKDHAPERCEIPESVAAQQHRHPPDGGAQADADFPGLRRCRLLQFHHAFTRVADPVTLKWTPKRASRAVHLQEIISPCRTLACARREFLCTGEYYLFELDAKRVGIRDCDLRRGTQRDSAHFICLVCLSRFRFNFFTRHDLDSFHLLEYEDVHLVVPTVHRVLVWLLGPVQLDLSTACWNVPAKNLGVLCG